MISAALREPLAHFLLAGAGLFLLFSYVTDSPDVADDEIVVTSGQIEHLTTVFIKTWQRAPTQQELNGLIEAYILEEVLYREAKAIGLDQDDTIIRRRLKQKMEFLVDDFSATDPSDVDLQQFLDANPERFRTDAHITFEHLYFADAGSSAAETALAALQNGETIDPAITAPSGLLPQRFDNASEITVSGQFGEKFKDVLFSLESGKWTGPVKSPFGVHLVKIDDLVEGYIPDFDEIRDIVQREWVVDRRETTQRAFFDSLRDRYTITIEEYIPSGL